VTIFNHTNWKFTICNHDKLKEMVKISLAKKEIIIYLGKNINATNSQISSFLGKDEGNISKHLKKLKNDGLIEVYRKSEGRITKNYNNLTERGIDVLRTYSEDREIEQIVENSRQVENNLVSLPSINKYDLDNINLRRTELPLPLDLYLDTTKIQVELSVEDVEFFWEVHTKMCNMRVKKEFTNKFLKILRGF